ncbi:MAG: response regulator [Desulfuromonadales bacterium]
MNNSIVAKSDVRLLVAEDNPFNVELIKIMLDSLEYPEAVFVTTGRQACEACNVQQYDLILMDCNMPEMDGYEATRHIRTLESSVSSMLCHRPSIIIAMTGDSMPDNQEECRKAGIDDFLPKPFTIQHFKNVLQRWLPESD